MLNIAVCDDEKLFSDMLTEKISAILSAYNEDVCFTSFTDSEQLLEKNEEFDLILLDIMLENSDGIETAYKIRKQNKKTDIILVTSLEDRVFEGFEVSAFDYVLKSSADDRLPAVIRRFMEKRKASSVVIKLADGTAAVIPTSEILWLESDGRGSCIGTRNKEYYTRTAIGKLIPSLPPEQYTEIHKSIYVNIGSIKTLSGNTAELVCGKVFPMSRRRKKEVMDIVMNYLRNEH
jgi:DNA-binding LytR/AlgR family response regulator